MAVMRALSAAAIFALALFVFLPSAGNTIAIEGQTADVTNTGLDIPALGLGTWLSDKNKVAHATKFALTGGYDHIDAAWIYRNEDQTGKGIVSAGRPRSSLWVTSKLWNAHHRPAEAEAAIKKSLADLQVDYLDLYLMHWPVAFVPGASGNELDEKTSILDTWRTMEGFVAKGYTRHIGISNFDRKQVEAVLTNAKIKPYAHEFETHPYLQQQAFVDFHEQVGVKVIAYSPLANTNPVYDRGLGPILQDPFWVKLAESKNATVAQVVLAWGIYRGTVVIPRSVKENHIADNLGALDVTFSEAELEAIGKEDKKVRLNNPGKNWGVKLFADLDDPTKLDDVNEEL